MTDPGAINFPSWQTCSVEHYLDFTGQHPATLQLMLEDYSYTNTHHCVSSIGGVDTLATSSTYVLSSGETIFDAKPYRWIIQWSGLIY